MLGFGSSDTELDRVIYYIGIIYDGTGLGTVMVGVWFLSDCSPLFLIIRLQNIYRQSFYV